MAQHVVHTQLPGQLVMLGCGSIGQAVLPLILRHLGVTPDRITIVTADGRGRDEAAEYGIAFHEVPLTRENYRRVLEPLVGVGDFLLNLSVDVSSTAIVALLPTSAAPSISTPWSSPGAASISTAACRRPQRSNYALREEHAAAAPRARPRPDRGQRPGRQPRPGLAAGQGGGADRRPRHRPAARTSRPTGRAGRGCSATSASRRSTSPSATPRSRAVPKRPGEFVNTWSIDGFVSEGCQPAELGWGTHERHFPQGRPAPRRRLRRGDLPEPARRRHARAHLDAATTGPFHGFLVTHNEAISIADYLTLRDGDAVALPADRALRLPPLRRRGAVGARAGRPRLAAAGRAAAADGRDRHRHGRARRAADGPQEAVPSGTARS